MPNINNVKENTDILSVAEKDTSLRYVASTGGGEWAGACPFCGGVDRFRVQPEKGKWFCRGCGGDHWHDVIDYIMRRDGLPFKDAVQVLGGIPSARIRKAKAATDPPGEKWQARGNTLLGDWENNLWGEYGEKAIKYLTTRGLAPKTIQKYKLGYIPKDVYEDPQLWGMDGTKIYLPRGVVLPCFVGEDLWYLNIRQPKGIPKYRKIRGSKSALFGTLNLRGAWLAMLTEGEFDCMLADQELGDVVGVATFGSASGRIDMLNWGRFLLPIKVLLTAFDADETGNLAANQLAGKVGQVTKLPVPALRPGDTDLTDYHIAGGDLWEWLKHHTLKRGIIENAEIT